MYKWHQVIKKADLYCWDLLLEIYGGFVKSYKLIQFIFLLRIKNNKGLVSEYKWASENGWVYERVREPEWVKLSDKESEIGSRAMIEK